MRVCIVSQEYPPVSEYYGGIGTQYARLAPQLAILGHDVHIITLAPGDAHETELEGVRVHALARPRLWPWFEFAWSGRIRTKLVELGEFDAVLSPEFRGEAALYALDQSSGPLTTHLLTSLRQLLTIRPGLTWWDRHSPRTRAGLWVERAQTERSGAVFAPGSAVLEWARNLWDISEIPARILPLTIGVGGVLAAARTGRVPAQFPESGPIVTFASRMDGHKGAQHLIQAMHIVWRTHPDAQLVYVGRDAPWNRGMMSDHLRQLAGEHTDRTHVLGYQEPGPYFAAIAASEVVAIPSMWESYCLAAVEAMALGRPVIGTTGHGFSEFMEDGRNGLLVPRGSVDALAAAIERLIDDAALRAQLGNAAAETGAAHDPERVAPLYVSALSGG